MSMSIEPLSGTHLNKHEIRRQCLEIRDSFNSHYAAKPHEQEIILDHALTMQPDDIIVELGICNGQTAAMLARASFFTNSFYYGIDFFGLENSAENIRELFDVHNLPGQIIEGRTQDVGRTWTKYVNRTEYDGYQGIGLLFVDAGHDEENVKADIEIWLPLVRPGGVVIFHDYDDPYNPQSPHWAVRYYADMATAGLDPGTGKLADLMPGWDRQIVGSMLIARKPIPKKLAFIETPTPTSDEALANTTTTTTKE